MITENQNQGECDHAKGGILGRAQVACEDFTEFIDAIYYEGYAEKLAITNPAEFNFQLNEYLKNYNHE